MEAFGLLTRIQLPKSVVITMTVQSGQAAQPRNAQEQPDFARQLREVLSDWVIGKTTAAETGVICGQLVSLAKTEIADRDTGLCLDTHSNTTSAHSGTLVTEHRETALCCIAHAALQKILHKSRFDDSSPLVDFFRFDLGEEWAAFIESAKDLAGLILDTEASVTDFDMDEDQERLKSLRKPFYRFWQRHRRWWIEPGVENRLYNANNPPPSLNGYPAGYRRHTGLPVCHETKGRGSLIPR